MHLDIHKAKLILDVNGEKMKGKKKKKENIFKSRDFCNLKKKKKSSNPNLPVDIYGVYVRSHSRSCS